MSEKKSDEVAFMRKRREGFSHAYAGFTAEQVGEGLQQEMKDEPLSRQRPRKDMDESVKNEYVGYADPVISWQIHFNITNESGFTLEKPVVTFRIPTHKKHPHRSREDRLWSRRTFNSNLYNSREELRTLEFADTSLISNSNLAYGNPDEEIALWIRMVLDDGRAQPGLRVGHAVMASTRSTA